MFSSSTRPSASSSWAISRLASLASSGVSCSAVTLPPVRRLFRLAAMKALMAGYSWMHTTLTISAMTSSTLTRITGSFPAGRGDAVFFSFISMLLLLLFCPGTKSKMKKTVAFFVPMLYCIQHSVVFQSLDFLKTLCSRHKMKKCWNCGMNDKKDGKQEDAPWRKRSGGRTSGPG